MQNATTPQTFRALVAEVAARAKARLPQAVNGRIEGAVKLVLAHDVTRRDDGAVEVGSGTDPLKVYHLHGRTCECTDFTTGRAPEGWCRHLLAACIDQRVEELLAQQTSQAAPIEPEPPQAEAALGIDPRWLQMIHGKPFVVYAGLLHMARAAGLVRLEAQFIRVTPDMALASATATFADGRVFREAADAAPGNVNVKVRQHFPRMALTRAKARALRDALGLELCSVEELD